MKHSTLFKSMLLMLCLLTAGSAQAATKVQAGRYYFTVDETHQTAALTSKGESSLSTTNVDYLTGDVELPSSFAYNGTIYTVTSIGANALAYCKDATSFVVPATVTKIETSAFYGCTSLTSVTGGASLVSIGSMAFRGCTALKSIALPNTLKVIGPQAFFDSGLTSLEIPAGVSGISVYDSPFGNCASLATITVASGNTHYMAENNALYSISKDTLFVYAPAQTAKSFTVTSKVIQPLALSEAVNLENLTLANSVTKIGQMAIDGCSNLKTLSVGTGITYCNEQNFYDLPSLTTINVATPNSKYSKVGDCLCSSDGTILYICPEGKLGRSFTVPEGITQLATYSFYRKRSLKSLTLPSTLKDLNALSVSYLSLDTLKLKAITAPTRVFNTFNGSSIKVLVVPDASLEAYQANATWNTVADTLINTSVANLVYKVLDENAHTASVTYVGGNIVDFDIDDTLQKDYVKGDLVVPSTCTIADKTYTVAAIDGYAFNGCTGLTSITLPATLTTISVGAFGDCTSLDVIDIPASVTRVEPDAFTGSLWWQNQLRGVVYINHIAYKFRKNLMISTHMTLEAGTTSINEDCFLNQMNLTSITLPSTVTEIRRSAFENTGLTSFTFPSSVANLAKGHDMFSGCTKLTTVTLPDDATVLPPISSRVARH